MEQNIISIIQAILAPGIMISACALLLLGMNNKYSMVVSRIRVLDEEKRKLQMQRKKSVLNEDEENRFNSISLQTNKLNYRMRLIRNAVVVYTIAIAFFLTTGLTIGLQFIVHIDISILVAILFLAGMLSVFVGVMHAAKEVLKGYEIMQIEINYTEKLHHS